MSACGATLIVTGMSRLCVCISGVWEHKVRRTTVVAGVAEVPDAEGARGAAPLIALAAGRADIHVGSLARGELRSALLRSPRGLARPAHYRVSRLQYRCGAAPLVALAAGRADVHVGGLTR